MAKSKIPASNGVDTPPPTNIDVPKIETFWYVDIDKKNKIKIVFSRLKFIDWIKKMGYYQLRISYDRVVMVRVVDNIVDYTDLIEIKKTIIDYIKSLPKQFDLIFREQLLECIITGASNYFSTSTLDFLDQIKLNIVTDTVDAIHLFFNNTVVKITSDSITEVPYSSINGHIWKSYIVDRSFTKMDNPVSDFGVFLKNISGAPAVIKKDHQSDEEHETEVNNMVVLAQNRHIAFKTTMGYMISTHKNRSKPIIPILCDMKISDTPSGGSGKGIFARAIGQVRNMLTFDGRNPKLLDGDFAFQRVNPDTQVIFFDDVIPDFNFERLFSIATEGLSISKKNKQEQYLEFEKSPKIITSTNYTIKGSSVSSERRKSDIEFCNHYDLDKTPESEFGHKLYDEWNNDQWNNFYNELTIYAQEFLINGIISPKSVNIEFKNLIAATSPEFYAYFNELFIIPQVYDKIYTIPFLEAYLSDQHITDKVFSMKKMCKAIPLICDYHKLIVKKGRDSDGKRLPFFDLSGNTKMPAVKKLNITEEEANQELPF